jgi:hypothetical protein
MMARLFTLLLLLLALPATAADRYQGQFRQLGKGEVLQIRPDRAYVLLRIDTSYSKFNADLLRLPSPAELAAYDAARVAAHAKAGAKAGPIENFAFEHDAPPNLLELAATRPLAMDGKLAIVVAEVMPGDYVFYGEGYAGFLYECFCLGTVGFPLKAGVVTDLGTMLVAKASAPSPIPELAGEVDLGPSASMDYMLFAVALRPARPGDVVPPGISVQPARLHAVGPFVEANTMLINRLAPIPGVLAYDRGKVMDVASGSEAKPN